jgi:hypothetical protein
VPCTSHWPNDCPDQLVSGKWIVDLFDLNGKTWIPLFAVVPAFLAWTLVFLDNGISWHLVNHPSHKITHGTAYCYDTFIMAFMIAINSMLGLPWLTAATVLSNAPQGSCNTGRQGNDYVYSTDQIISFVYSPHGFRLHLHLASPQNPSGSSPVWNLLVHGFDILDREPIRREILRAFYAAFEVP